MKFQMRRYKKVAKDADVTDKTDETGNSGAPEGTRQSSGGFGGDREALSTDFPPIAQASERLPDGRLNASYLRTQPGLCITCARWIGPDEYGQGLCPLGQRSHGWPQGNPDLAVTITPFHRCAARGGSGWRPKPRERDSR